MAVRAKLQLQEIHLNAYNKHQKKFIFYPIYDTSIPENERFMKATPSGRIELTVENPDVFDEWQLGDYFYSDFTKTTREGT